MSAPDNPRPTTHAPSPRVFATTHAPTLSKHQAQPPQRRTLVGPALLCIALLMLTLTACKSEPAPPPVSVGNKGQTVAPKAAQPPDKAVPDDKVAPAPSKADAGAAADKAAKSPDKADAKPPAPPKGKLPAPDPKRLDYLQDPTLTQQDLIRAAKEALAAGNDAAAQQALETLRNTPELSGIKISGILLLADFYRQQNRQAEALTMLEALYRKAPVLPELTFVLAQTYKDNGRIPEAIAGFEQALAAQPLLLRAHIEIGGLNQQQGNQEASTQAFLNYERAIFKYSKILEDPVAHIDDKLKIAEAFSFLPDDRAAPALLESLKDSDPKVRLAVADALGQIATDDTIKAMETFAEQLGSQDPDLTRALQDAIKTARSRPQ